MASMPSNPKIYHITHVSNLAGIVTNQGLISDANRITTQLSCSLVGMSTIKQRRLNEIEVSCYPGTKVGQYVPFYFCPRLIMLYILYQGNHPELTYKDGQQPIVHLQADLYSVIQWANNQGVNWAFSDRNAGAYLATFYNRFSYLSQLNWSAIEAKNFRNAQIKEGKQAEFLMFDFFPWELIEKIGTFNNTIVPMIQNILTGIKHQPMISVERNWYF
jgi:hypothetical protein